jgi:hypothetical protein
MEKGRITKEKKMKTIWLDKKKRQGIRAKINKDAEKAVAQKEKEAQRTTKEVQEAIKKAGLKA